MTITKKQLIAKLEEQNFDRTHTLRKTWEQVNGINRYGWFIATLHGWKHLGSTIAESMDHLEAREEWNS